MTEYGNEYYKGDINDMICLVKKQSENYGVTINDELLDRVLSLELRVEELSNALNNLRNHQ